ncbi:MAG: CDP-alcohol phosphatidyltransferase family protein [Tannerellaceae bacterium]|jgi:hypothetical protein|nr:CDP-alcohol phosphatidyltransferase family protein [Tannerellaceae bacterium]
MQKGTKNPGIEATFKSLDTEEPVDIYFYRPVGYGWALLFRKLGVSPNAVTIAAVFIGIAAGICFYFQDITVNVTGMLLLVWANSFDSADGQLARMTGKTSPLGRMLDGLCGNLWFIAIYAAICSRLFPQWGIWIWILAAATGFSHTTQASMADYYRNVHLLFLKGKAGSELADSATLKENGRKMSWKKDFICKLFDSYYINYTARQERQSPELQQMMKIIRLKYNAEAPGWFRKAFREKSLPLMKYTNMLSFNTRVAALFISLFINKPWLYFAFEITVLNVMLIYMIVKHERICAQFTKQLES